jgi:small subunit ribosomal protein S6
MRQYELVTIFHSEEEFFKKGKESVMAELVHQGAEIVKEDDMGDRPFTFPIKKKERGHYWLYTINLPPDKIIQAEKVFKLDTNILKYLFVRKEE